MTPAEVNRFDDLCHRHLRLLMLQGKSRETIDVYSLSVRRVSEYFDCCRDILTPAEIEQVIGKTRKLRYQVFLRTTHSPSAQFRHASP